MTKAIFSATLCLSMCAFCALAEAQQTSQAEQDAVDFMGALATVCKSARPVIAAWAGEVRQAEAAQTHFGAFVPPQGWWLVRNRLQVR